MKKLIFRLAILMAGLVGVSIVNNVILLKMNPLEFYYTPTGLMISAIIMGVEAIILYPTVMWYVCKFLTMAVTTENNKESD